MAEKDLVSFTAVKHGSKRGVLACAVREEIPEHRVETLEDGGGSEIKQDVQSTSANELPSRVDLRRGRPAHLLVFFFFFSARVTLGSVRNRRTNGPAGLYRLGLPDV